MAEVTARIGVAVVGLGVGHKHLQAYGLRFVFSDLTVTSAAPNPYRPGEAPWTFEAPNAALQAQIDAALQGMVPGTQGFAGQFEALHASLTQGTPPAVGLGDAGQALELVTAIYHSAETGLPVSLPLPAGHARRASWTPVAGGFARGQGGA